MHRLQNGILTLPASSKDKTKDWQLEILMEKLRSKAAQYKTLPEISKNVRMNLLEKRYALDSVEKSQHQKCLDTLQHSIKVTSFQSMVERLESLTRQLGLKLVVEPTGVFISSDMFYLEIVLEPTGAVKDVKIHHEGKKDQQSCTELVNCLSRGDFSDFTAQLEGFASIYQLNAEKKVKCKAFTALESLEADLSTLAQLQAFIKDPFHFIHKSPVGILEKRRGGHAMKLTYFVSPYDLLNVEKNDLEMINIDNIVSKSLGCSVTVCMEGSAAHKLQTSTVITVNRNMNGKSTPSYSPLTAQNSAVIPACFVLKLNKPMPMCLSLVRQIQQIHPWTDIENIPAQPLLNLIVSHASDGKMESSNNKGLFVTLPDQNHCYFMTENKNMDGVLVTSIPFTHPAHVAKILMVLREQALFNTIIGSCVRPNSRQDFDNMTMFEVSALSPTHISISLEHPIEESMATAEINLTDITNLECHIQDPGTPPPVNAPSNAVSDLASKILNKCLSLPVTMRSIIKLWEEQAVRRTHYGGGQHENFSLPLGPGDPGGRKGGPGPGLGDFGSLGDKMIKQEPMGGAGGHGMMMQAGAGSGQGMFLNESMMASNFPNFPPSDGVLSGMELTNILSDTAEKCAKRQKRRSDDLWKSGKRKVGQEDSDMMESSSCDSTSRSTPLSQEIDVTTPNSMLGFQTDLDLDPAEILGVADKCNTEFDGLDDLGDVEDITKETKRRQEKSPDLMDKSMVAPLVSITPIPSSPTSGYSLSGSQEKRSGIEIIPVPQATSSLLPSSITITPISPGQGKLSEEKTKEKRSSKSSRDDKNRSEKRKKRKRDESPMGPPDKVPPKQDPLTKPVTVSIKPTESPPATPTSPSMIRKFSASPTPNRTMSLSGKLSPNLMKPNLKSGSSHQSPRHSPAHVPSSPKHSIPGISSPKHHGTSPKHPSASGSGKPSMSTLKSAANSPSNKGGGDSKKSSSKDGSRDKDKKLSGIFVANSKTKSSNKVKPLDLNAGEVAQDGLPSPSDCSKSNSGQARNRKGSLSAIVDKLKVNAQHCDTATDLSSKSSSGRDRTSANVSKSGESKSSAKLGETKNSEYMVKPSSDGMKITINKTRSKDSSSTKSSSSVSVSKTGSPKIHTGLKPGVNSGPASKKPQQLQKTSASNVSNSTIPSYGGSVKTSASSNKISSSGTSKLSSGSAGSGGMSKSTSKLSGSPKTGSSATDLSRTKDRLKPGKSGSEKSLFSRKSSPTPGRDEADVFKSKMDSFGSNLMMEGMMKQLDKNFQIPKLSARASDDKKKNDLTNNVNSSTVDRKLFDMVAKNDIGMPKYPLAVPGSKMFENAMEQKVRNNVNSFNSMAMGKAKDDEDGRRKDIPQNLSGSQGKDESYKSEPTSVPKPFSSAGADSLGLSAKGLNLTSKFLAPAPRDDRKDSRRSDNDVLDFSSKLGPQSFPQSPSVSVHIVKSPAPSPLINPSPHSASPCITDDELMDEALVGLGK